MEAKDIYEDSINRWSQNGGIGTLSYDNALDIFTPIKEVLTKYFSYDPKNRAIVVVAAVSRMDEWSSHLIKDFDYAHELGNRLTFMTADKIIVNKSKDYAELIIFDQIDRFYRDEKLKIVKGDYITSKFKLGVTNSPNPDNDSFGIYEHCPVVHRVTKVDVVTHGILDGAVEMNVPVTLSEVDSDKLKEYSTFIKDTIDMFNNDFNLVLCCYSGDAKQGLSADYFRNELATSRGWHKDIDTSSKYYANIDRYYNPNALYERAKSFTEVVRKRKNLLNNNTSKIDTIVNIVEKYKDKKILIINKSSLFARMVTIGLNDHVTIESLKQDAPNKTLFTVRDENRKGFVINSSAICVEYHPDVESKPLIDIDTNDYIRYKSGARSGEVKQFGSTTLNKIANDRFNKGFHNVISTSNAMPKDANLTIDFIIVTSPECNTINTFQYRVHRLDFVENVKIVNIYLSGTKEEHKLREKQALTKNKVIKLSNDINDLNL